MYNTLVVHSPVGTARGTRRGSDPRDFASPPRPRRVLPFRVADVLPRPHSAGLGIPPEPGPDCGRELLPLPECGHPELAGGLPKTAAAQAYRLHPCTGLRHRLRAF